MVGIVSRIRRRSAECHSRDGFDIAVLIRQVEAEKVPSGLQDPAELPQTLDLAPARLSDVLENADAEDRIKGEVLKGKENRLRKASLNVLEPACELRIEILEHVGPVLQGVRDDLVARLEQKV